jgi:hypothetical protein
MPRRKTLLVLLPFLLSTTAILVLHWQINRVPPIAGSMFRISLTQVSFLPVILFMIPVVAWIYEQMWTRFIAPGPIVPPPDLDWPIPAEVLLRGLPFMPPMPGMPDLPRPPVRQEEGTGQDAGAEPVEYLLIEVVEIQVIPVPLLPRGRPKSSWQRFADRIVNLVVVLMILFFVVMLIKGLFDPASKRDYMLAGLYFMWQVVLGAITLTIWRRRRSNRNQTPPAVQT